MRDRPKGLPRPLIPSSREPLHVPSPRAQDAQAQVGIGVARCQHARTWGKPSGLALGKEWSSDDPAPVVDVGHAEGLYREAHPAEEEIEPGPPTGYLPKHEVGRKCH